MSSDHQSHSIVEPVLISEAPKEAAYISEIECNVHSSPLHEIMLVSEAPKEEVSFYAEEFARSVIENPTVEESSPDQQIYMERSGALGYDCASIDGAQRNNQDFSVDMFFEAESESNAVVAGLSALECDAKDDSYPKSDNLSEVECGVSRICLSKINSGDEMILSEFKPVASSEVNYSSIVEECRMPFSNSNGNHSVHYSMKSVTDLSDAVDEIFVDIPSSTMYDMPNKSFKWRGMTNSEHIHTPSPGISLKSSDLHHVTLSGQHFPPYVLEGTTMPSEHVANLENSFQRSMKSVESLECCVPDMGLDSGSPSDLFRQEAFKLGGDLQGSNSVSVADASCFVDERQANTHISDQPTESNEASLRRSSRANKFTQKAPNKNRNGKGSKKALARTMDFLPTAVRSRRSRLNRSARVSDWGLYETLSKFIQLNAFVDQGSGLGKSVNKSRKKDKVEVGGGSRGSYATGASSGHIRLKLKLVNRSKSIIDPNPLVGTNAQSVNSIKDITQEPSPKSQECLYDMKLDSSATSEENPKMAVLPVSKVLGAPLMSDKCSTEGIGARSFLDKNGEKSGVSTDDRHLNSGTSPDSEVIQAPGSQFPCDVSEGRHYGGIYSSKATLTPAENAVPIISKPRRKKGSKKETACQLADSVIQNSLPSSSIIDKSEISENICANGPKSDLAIRFDVGHESGDSRNLKKLHPPAKAQGNRKSKSKLKPSSSTQRPDPSKSRGVKGDKWKLAGTHEMDGRGNKTSTTTTGVTSEDVSVLPVVPGPRRAWVCCDDCLKWRCIPSNLVDIIDDTNCRWTCKDNQDKAFSDCSVPQEKSNEDINAELNISDVEEGHDVNLSGPQQSSWMLIKSNIFLHRRRKKQSLDEIMVCHCKSTRDGKLGCGDECLNRMLNIECVQGTCPCGDLCANQQFQRQSYADLKWFRSGKKGYGLQVMEDVTQGQFLIEYVGEVLELPTYEARLRVYASEGHKHFYFMTLNGNEVIDACGKGNLGRFINHSCDPNCRTEKWMVNGEICIGIFAVRNIKKGEELTFDYNYVRVFGAAAKKCHCGSAQCRGYIGGDRLNNEAIVQGDSDEEFPEPVALYENGDIADEYNVMSKSSSLDVMEEKNEDASLQNDVGVTSDDKDMINNFEHSEKDSLHDSVAAYPLVSSSLEILDYMEEENVDKIPLDVQQEKPMSRICSVSPKTSDNLSVNRLHPGSVSESVDTKIDRSSTEMAGGEAFPSVARLRMEISRPSKHAKSKESSEHVKSKESSEHVKSKESCEHVKSKGSSGISATMEKPLLTSNKSQPSPNKLKKVVESAAKHSLETVEGKLNELLDKVGGICKRKDAFKGYLKLLVLTAASGDSSHHETIQSNKDLSMILDAILKTKSRTVLTDILNKNGLQMLHSLMKKCRGNFNKIPILRKLLKIFEVLAERKILTLEHINAEPPRPGMESFRKSILTLTEYKDRKVHQIARSFRDRWIPRPVKKFNSKRKTERNMHYQNSDQAERPSSVSLDSDGFEGSPQPTVRRIRKRKSGWDQLPSDIAPRCTKEQKTEPGSSFISDSDHDRHEMDEDAPPGFSKVIPISQQYPGPLNCPSEIQLGLPQEIYNSELPMSYGIPFHTVQEFGTPQSSTSDRWVIAPGMPFQPFPPLPSYERSYKKQRQNDLETPLGKTMVRHHQV